MKFYAVLSTLSFSNSFRTDYNITKKKKKSALKEKSALLGSTKEKTI